ncbi:hypothetical protein BDV93DRAFT_524780 [Ceratobasidium sp. AG-I]|nr:hypothetical protein BDV93DRAFT_524780 [Ceratobasidium sp. AG-I]
MPVIWSNPTPLPDAYGEIECHAFKEDDQVAAKPLVELEMTRLSAALRMKPSWWTKFRDENILVKWRAEALEQAELMEESHIDYVLKELDGYAKLRDESSGAEVSCYDRIWQSDTLVPASLRDRLIAGASKLENVPDSEKDWHPRSNGQVLDLVHPSLYPIVYGRTLAYPGDLDDRNPAMLIPIPIPDVLTASDSRRARYYQEKNYHVSRRFQWLPTDFQVSDDGKSVKSLGYINNINPDEHATLHATVEELVGAFLPLFERALTDSLPENIIIPQRVTNGYSYDEEYEPSPNEEDFEDADEFDERYREWEAKRPFEQPDVKAEGYVLGSLERRGFWYSLNGRTIQVIVKLANIHLTPETPDYKGGSWHIEGMSNESIAVSGIYYYDEENITESRLAFRTAAAIPISYEQGDLKGCMLTWGITDQDPCVNELGSVVTSQDRCIAFPNTYQHRVSPFELADKTKPGHRKILALFLIDPAIHKPSTTTVPPQQQEWRAGAIAANPILKAAFDNLAPEIIGQIDLLAEGTMTRKEAEEYRLELMDERTVFVDKNTDTHFSVAFSMCEH